MNPKALEKAKEKARKKRAEWDFTKLAPHERPMAVAWEYGRELKDSFQKCLKKGKRRDRFVSDVLHPVYLDFIHSPHWPHKPYQSLTQQQRRQAFPRAPWPLDAVKKERGALFLEDISGLVGRDPNDLQIIRDKLFPQNTYDPCKAVLVIDLGKNSNATLREFEAYLQRKDLLLRPGRQAHEKDLSALGALRLYSYFNGNDYPEDLKESDPTKKIDPTEKTALVSTKNRLAYIKHAKARLGNGDISQSRDIKPLFSFFRFLFSFDDEEDLGEYSS